MNPRLLKLRVGFDSHCHSITSVDAVGVTDFPPRDFPIKELVLRSRAELERTTFEKQTCELGIKPTIRLLAACA
jgi:hypothetical protein